MSIAAASFPFPTHPGTAWASSCGCTARISRQPRLPSIQRTGSYFSQQVNATRGQLIKPRLCLLSEGHVNV